MGVAITMVVLVWMLVELEKFIVVLAPRVLLELESFSTPRCAPLLKVVVLLVISNSVSLACVRLLPLPKPVTAELDVVLEVEVALDEILLQFV